MKLPTAHPQTNTAIDDVTRIVGTSTIKAMLIQNSANRTAAPSAKATVDREKTAKVRIGRKEKMSCATTKDWVWLLAMVGSGRWGTYEEDGSGVGVRGGVVVGALAGGWGHDAVERVLGVVVGGRSSVVDRGADAAVVGSVVRHGCQYADSGYT